MGPVNWLAVVLAGVSGALVSRLVADGRRLAELPAALGLMLLSAAMLGHNFARIGAATLAAKPWLYAMQAGGLALAFVIPALWLVRRERPVAVTARDSLALLLGYLAMGAVFWAAG